MFRFVFFLSLVLLPAIARAGNRLKIDSTISQSKNIQWPFVYPHDYKASAHIGSRFLKMPDGSSFSTMNYSASFELIWTQILSYGMGYEGNFVSARGLIKATNIHRVNLNLGIILILDSYEKNHLLLYLRPGIGFLRSEAGNVTRPGIGFGIAYEYSLNSNWLIGPEILYYRYPILDKYPYGFSGYTVSLRIAYGK